MGAADDWLRWWFRMIREPRKPSGHPLVGHMREATLDDVREMLKRRPPTLEEADAIAADELANWDRAEVYALLDSYHPKERWTE